MKSFIDNVIDELNNIRDLMLNLLDISTLINEPTMSIGGGSYSSLGVVIGTMYFQKSDEQQQRLQHQLKPLYEKWFNTFQLLTRNFTDRETREFEAVYKLITNWIERDSTNIGLPSTIPKAKEYFLTKIELYYKALQYLKGNNTRKVILIPDTNALIQQPEPKMYTSVAGQNNFTFLLTPTVSSELDELKNRHNNPTLKDKAKSVVNRIKGYRNQGRLIDGVTVHSSILIKAIAVEPNFSKTLSILSSDNADDRLIATAIEVQIAHPDALICIVTSDTNLQNKCEMIGFPFNEVPDNE